MSASSISTVRTPTHPDRTHARDRARFPRSSSILILFALYLAATPAAAQRWELGIGAGGGIYSSEIVTNRRGDTAEAGFSAGPLLTVHLGQTTRGAWGGEIRYTWQRNALRLENGSTTATLAGQSHAIHYDVLYHFARPESKVRPYAAGGAGAKYFEGTGTEVAIQPLNQFAFLTRTGEWQPLVTVAGGIKIQASRRIQIRLEARDWMTPVPRQILTPAPGATLGGWLHDLAVLGILTLSF